MFASPVFDLRPWIPPAALRVRLWAVAPARVTVPAEPSSTASLPLTHWKVYGPPEAAAQAAVDDHDGIAASEQRGDAALQVVERVAVLGKDDQLLPR